MPTALAALLFALSIVLAPGPSQAEHPTLCPDGVYVVEGPPLIPRSGVARDAITIDHGRVAIASGCEYTPARIVRRENGSYYVRAGWWSCKRARRVRLDARVAPGCSEMAGHLRIKRPRLHRRFVATRCDDHDPDCLSRCATDADCAATEWCAKQPGHCDDRGVCRDRQPDTMCPAVYDPVCGCDGVTYGNTCEASRASANVRHEGACEIACNVTEPCPEGEFCEMPPGICASGLDAGLCVDVPELCPDIYRPVCGCDGVTYSNDCERRAAKVQKSRDGPCFCAQILCAPGTVPVDRDGDGCDDACLAPCETACDCYAKGLEFEIPCPLLCPMCGNWWSCEAGFCVEHCGFIPPQECHDPATDLMTPR